MHAVSTSIFKYRPELRQKKINKRSSFSRAIHYRQSHRSSGRALAQALKEISRMSETVVNMVEKSITIVQNIDNTLAAALVKQDDEVDFLHESIIRYCTGISKSELSPEEWQSL